MTTSWPLRAALVGVLLALLALCGVASTPAQTVPQTAVQTVVPEKYAGTYRIESWRKLQARDLYHFFYLHPDGTFLLAAAWPRHEESRFVGRWTVTDDRLYLNGAGDVRTNQGDWRTEFKRTYRIRVTADGFVLAPEPRKNRYGLLGWPNAFAYHRRQPAPNLPGEPLPADTAAMGAHIARLLAAQQ